MKLCRLLAILLGAAAYAQTGAWSKLEFLLGNWTGAAAAKDTPNGAGQGEFSFQPELQQKIIVRRNTANYDSSPRHDDLMVIYLQPENTPRAIYFDTEGHVIRYNLAFPAPNRVVFESDGTQPGPKYRLTYWLEGPSLNGTFEIAMTPGDFKSYLSWTSKKR